jgi:hypothetical protein
MEPRKTRRIGWFHMAIIARERTADTKDRCRLASGVEVAAVMNSSQVI